MDQSTAREYYHDLIISRDPGELLINVKTTNV